MGTVYNRGSKHAPRWWVGYQTADGAWKYEASGQATKDQARKILVQIEGNIAAGRVGMEAKGTAPAMGKHLDDWSASLTNRNAKDDKSRIKRALVPMFKTMLVRDVTLAVVMKWIDAMKTGDLSSASQRHKLNLLSRFFSWAVERGYASMNPVRSVPQGRRPTQAAKTARPYLDDDAKVLELVAVLPDPLDKMFLISNRSGLRTGEVAGLRLSDFDFLAEGVLRVRHSYNGPLKEDRGNGGKTKWVPASEDLAEIMAEHLAHRKAEGATAEDFVFFCPTTPHGHYRKEFIEQRWEKASTACKVPLTWYEATRHSFVSRNMAAGISLDEISAAVGHANPTTTRRYYDHFVRKTFSPSLTRSLGPK